MSSKDLVSIKDDVVIGKAGDRELLADLFLPREDDLKKPAIVVLSLIHI